MSSYSVTSNETFTLTHAKYIASKVATDLLRFQRFYGEPKDAKISDYESELTEFIRHGYLETITYGFKRSGNWVEAVRYRALSDGSLVTDEDPGKLRPGANLEGTVFGSFLTYRASWSALSETERERFRQRLPIQRTSGEEPSVENGQWVEDRTYSAGGQGVSRSSIRRY